MTNLKINRCGIANGHTYIFYYETTENPYKFNYEMINYWSNNILVFILYHIYCI